MIGDIKELEWDHGNMTDSPREERFRRPTSGQGNFHVDKFHRTTSSELINSDHARRSGKHTSHPRESLLGSSAEVPEMIGDIKELEWDHGNMTDSPREERFRR